MSYDDRPHHRRDYERDIEFRAEDEEERTRVHYHPRTGTKVTTLIGLSLVAVAVYFLFAPVYMDTANGWFGCGNFIQGSDSEFVSNICKEATDRNRALAMLAGALAVVIGGLGAFLFGFDKEVEHRRAPSGDPDPSGEARHGEDDGHRSAGGRSGRGDRTPSRPHDHDDDLPLRPRRARSAWDD